jgi:GNAT superfamily N-acetyltransferase
VTSAIHDDPPLDACTLVLAAAFAEEPTVVRLCGKAASRRTAWFDALLRTHATLPGRRLLLIRDGRAVGVAIATAAGARPRPADQARWTLRTLRGCGPRTLFGTLAYLRRTEAWKPVDAWTLEFVGVLPEARGQGFARELYERAQEDHREAPAYLTTADPQNVELYQRWGFRAFVRITFRGLNVVGLTCPSLLQKEMHS